MTSAPAVSVVEYRGAGAIAAAREAWNSVLDRLPDTRPFSRPEWSEAWWAVYGRGREAVVLVFTEPAGPAGLVALQVTRYPPSATRRIEFLGGGAGTWMQWLLNPDTLGLAYFNDLLATPGREEVCLAGLRGWLRAHASEWDLLRLSSVPSTSALVSGVDAWAAGWSPQTATERRWYADISEGYEAYRASLGKRQRRHLRYEPNALERAAGSDLVLQEVRGREAAGAMEGFLRLHDRRWAAERKPGLQPGEAAFYRALAAGPAPGLVVFNLIGAGRLLASQFGFDHGARYLPYNFSFEPDFDKQSPANVLMQRVIERFCDGGHREVDLSGLGSGDRWTDRARQRVHISARSPGPLPHLRALPYRVARAGIVAVQGTSAGGFLRRQAAAAFPRRANRIE